MMYDKVSTRYGVVLSLDYRCAWSPIDAFIHFVSSKITGVVVDQSSS